MDKFAAFLASPAFGVLGASSNREKYGNKVLRCYMQNQKKVYPVNPREKVIEGIDCVTTLNELPAEVVSISVITPPTVTEKIVEQAIQKGIKNIWMQPGAESLVAIKRCEEAGINVIAGGACVLVVLGFKDI